MVRAVSFGCNPETRQNVFRDHYSFAGEKVRPSTFVELLASKARFSSVFRSAGGALLPKAKPKILPETYRCQAWGVWKLSSDTFVRGCQAGTCPSGTERFQWLARLGYWKNSPRLIVLRLQNDGKGTVRHRRPFFAPGAMPT